MERAWGSNPAFHAEFKGSHSGGCPFFCGLVAGELEETCRPAVDKVRPIRRHTLSKSHGGKVCRTALS